MKAASRSEFGFTDPQNTKNSDRTTYWHQNEPEDIRGVSESKDRFGRALTAGDFDDDGRDDLAVGVPRESIDDVDQAGAVNIIYGSAYGLVEEGNQIFHQKADGIENASPEAEDRFGNTVVSGDFDGTGYADLAIGVGWEDVNSTQDAGCVHVLYGLRR